MPEAKEKARAVGFNHVALEVGDIDEALAFYGHLFEVKLRGKTQTSAFIDLGDQFLALQKGRVQAPDDGRHFGLVVNDKKAVRAALFRRPRIHDTAVYQVTCHRAYRVRASVSPQSDCRGAG